MDTDGPDTPPKLTIEQIELNVRANPVRIRELVTRWLQAIDTTAEPVLARRLMLVQADCDSRRGRTESSMAVVRSINTWATAHNEAHLRARCLRLISATFRRIGATSLSLENAVASLNLLPVDASDFLRADHMQVLADALGADGAYEQSLARYRDALDLATRAGADGQIAVILNNLAYTYIEAGHTVQAEAVAQQMIAHASAHGLMLDAHNLDTIAAAYASANRLHEAAAVLRPVLDGRPDLTDGDFDGEATALLTMARVLRRLGDHAEAVRVQDRVRALCAQHGLEGLAVQLLQEEAELHAARGWYKEAFEMTKRFHDQSARLRTEQQEDRARALLSILEADEARREREYYRELALHDPLTGVHNRRYLNQYLDALLTTHQGVVLVALLDLDHFKSVNDTYSHATGDEVLARTARALDDLVKTRGSGLVARLGGEEFVIVEAWPSLPPSAEDVTGRAQEAVESARRAVAADDHGRSPDIRVTASVGAALAPWDGTARSELLAVADRRLYRAKARGRDRFELTG